MNFTPYIAIYTVAAAIVGLLPCVFFLVALVKYSRSPKAAFMVMIGSALLLFSFAGSAAFNFFGIKFFNRNMFIQYSMLANCISSLVQGGGLSCLAMAAFADRESRSTQAYEGLPAGPSDVSNPYRTPTQRS